MCDKQTCLSTPSVPAPIFALSAPSSSLFPPPPPPLSQRAPEDVHPLSPHPTARPPFACTRGQRDNPCPPPLLLVYAPTAPVPLPLALRVEGAGNPLCPVPRAPRAFSFPWHEEGCPGPPPSPSGSRPALRLHPSSHADEARGLESPHPPTPPFPALSHARLPHLRARIVCKGAARKGKGLGRAAVQQAQQAVGGNTITDVAAVQPRDPGRGGARKRKGGGVEKGSGGGREP